MIKNTSHESIPWYGLFFRNGHLLTLTILVILIAGISAVNSLPRLEDPRIDTRNVFVITPYPGASADRVEALVTDVIEDELRQLHEIKKIDSTSRAGTSMIFIELQAWVDNNTNQQIFSKIRDVLSNVEPYLPTQAGASLLDERRGATSFTLLTSVHSATNTQTPLSTVSRMADELADRLRNVSGTELVRIYGDLEEEIEVNIDAHKLSNAGVTIAQASKAIANADPKVSAGVLYGQNQNLRIQVSKELDSIETVRNLPLSVSTKAAYLRVGDVAEVSRSSKSPVNNIAIVNGQQGVFVASRMQNTVRVDQWTAKAQQIISDFNTQFGASVRVDIVFEQNIYTDARLSDLSQNLLLGSLVIIAVVFLFMGMKASWIVGLALPLCASFAIFSLSLFDEQIHQMSIFGIIIAVGLLIDNAIVITAEIRSRLIDYSVTRLDALIGSIQHLFVPLLASTLTTVLGFMPIFLLPGNIGDFIGSIAISVVMALLGSLFISLTIIAALAAHFLPRGDTSDKHWYERGINAAALVTSYRSLLSKALKKPLVGIMACIALALSGFVLAGQLGNVFFPSADRDQFEVYLWLPEGTAISETKSVVEDIDQYIRDKGEVKQLTWLVGGSSPSVYYNQLMNKDNSAHYANGVVTTHSVEDAQKLIGELQRELDLHYPESKIVVRAFGQGPPISAPVGLKIFGPDVEVLSRLGEQVRLAMSNVPGISQSLASVTFGEAELILATNGASSHLAGLTLVDIAKQLQFLLAGSLGGTILEGTEEVPIRIKLANKNRDQISDLQTLVILSDKLTAQQQWMPLSALGEFKLVPTLSSITRENGERVNRIEAFLLPGAMAIDVGNQVRQELENIEFSLPKGYRIQMAGDSDEQNKALGALTIYAPVLLVLMITTLILSFKSFKLAMVITSVAVLSVGFGMLSLWISGLPIGFNPLLGCAGLIGVAINGSIVVIAAVNANSAAKQGQLDEIVSETLGCSRHILSTTFTTVGGFIPLLLFSGGSFWPPLAVVLAGGVGFSVILSLVYTPLMLSMIFRKKTALLTDEPEMTLA